MVQHLPVARRFAVRLVGRSDAADDLMQTALCRAAAAWKTFAAESEFSTWLYRIVVNAFRDQLRRKPRLAVASVERSIDPTGRLDEAELAALIAQSVSTLPPKQREVLVLVAYEQLSPDAAANVLGISAGSARVHLHEARKRLKVVLADYL